MERMDAVWTSQVEVDEKGTSIEEIRRKDQLGAERFGKYRRMSLELANR